MEELNGDGVKKVDLEGGGHLMVRRLSRSVRGRVMQLSGMKNPIEDPGGASVFQEMLFRAAVVAWSDEVDQRVSVQQRAGTSVQSASSFSGVSLCAVEIYDSVTEADVASVLKVAAGELSETDRGN